MRGVKVEGEGERSAGQKKRCGELLGKTEANSEREGSVVWVCHMPMASMYACVTITI